MVVIEEKIGVSHHEHCLELINHQKPYTCDGCKIESSGPRYRCEPCNYDLHTECAFATQNAPSYHQFFPGCAFRFMHKPPKYCKNRKCRDSGSTSCHDCQRYCDGCGKPVDGFVYHCVEEGWDLHPRCLHLERNLTNIDGVEFRLRSKVDGKCIWCRKRKLLDSFSRIRGWSYVSDCGEYHFHVHCTTEMVLEAWKKQGGNNGNGDCLALERIEMSNVVANRSSRGGNSRGNKFLRIVRVFLKTFASIILGDPISFTCLLVELFA